MINDALEPNFDGINNFFNYMRKFFAKVMPCIAHKTAHRKVLWCFGCRLFFFGLHHLLTALPYLGISAVCSTSLVCNSRTQIIIHELDTHSNWLTVWFACSSYAYGKIHVVLKVENQQKKILKSYNNNKKLQNKWNCRNSESVDASYAWEIDFMLKSNQFAMKLNKVWSIFDQVKKNVE